MTDNRAYYIYLLTNQGRTVLYTGVTNSLVRPVTEHRAGSVPGFTARYNVNRLVYYEAFNACRDAISREKEIKGWRREKKEHLIATQNPRWTDLADTLLGLGAAPATRWKDAPPEHSCDATPEHADPTRPPS